MDFRGTFTLYGVDMALDQIVDLEIWLENNLKFTPRIDNNMVIDFDFTGIDMTTQPIDPYVEIPFKITLPAPGIADSISPDPAVSFARHSIYEDSDVFVYYNMVEMTGGSIQYFKITKCDNSIGVSVNGDCKSCTPLVEFQANSNTCNSNPSIRFFRYYISNNEAVHDNNYQFNRKILFEDFDFDPQTIVNFQSWLNTSLIIDPDLSQFGAQIIFDQIPAGIPSDNRLSLNFKILLSQEITQTQNVFLIFQQRAIAGNPGGTYYNIVDMGSPPPTSELTQGQGCDFYMQIMEGNHC
jgi:hypothetical protein